MRCILRSVSAERDEDEAATRPWPPAEPLELSPDWQEDAGDGEPPIVSDDPENPQWVEAFSSREEAEARAASINAEHRDQPFKAYISNRVGGGDEHLVTAHAFPTDGGRWAVLLVFITEPALSAKPRR